MNIAGCARAAVQVAAPTPSTSADVGTWDGVRALSPLDPSWLHFAGFLLASHPTPVREAIERHRRGFDENPALYFEAQEPTAEDTVRKAGASYMGVNADEIALTDSTTMGLGMLYMGLPLQAGQEILSTTHDHFVHQEAQRFAADRTGAVVRPRTPSPTHASRRAASTPPSTSTPPSAPSARSPWREHRTAEP